MSSMSKEFFQDHMGENVCFGCGAKHPEGLRIKSYWEGEEAVCHWQPTEKYNGWKGILNGGIIATLIDCHCMCSSMAHAYRLEKRSLDSTPFYRYATASMQLKYLKPTPTNHEVVLRASLKETHNRKTTWACQLFSEEVLNVIAEVVAVRVYDSSQEGSSSQVFSA